MLLLLSFKSYVLFWHPSILPVSLHLNLHCQANSSWCLKKKKKTTFNLSNICLTDKTSILFVVFTSTVASHTFEYSHKTQNSTSVRTMQSHWSKSWLWNTIHLSAPTVNILAKKRKARQHHNPTDFQCSSCVIFFKNGFLTFRRDHSWWGFTDASLRPLLDFFPPFLNDMSFKDIQ